MTRKAYLSRRSLVVSSAAVLTAGLPIHSYATDLCPAPGMPPGTCSAWVDGFSSQDALQKKSQWCWAACISMICRHYGYPTSQERIVTDVYGGIVNMPGDDNVLKNELNKYWYSDDGRKFKISADIFSPALGSAGVSNQRVVEDLKNNKPLLNGSATHATVTVRVDYDPAGYNVQRVHVIDPFPGVAPPPTHARFLNPSEMTAEAKGGSLKFLASITVSPA